MIRRTPAAGTNAEAAEFAARHPLGLGVSYGTFPLMAKAIPQPIRRGRRTRTAASPGNAFRATAIATPTGRWPCRLPGWSIWTSVSWNWAVPPICVLEGRANIGSGAGRMPRLFQADAENRRVRRAGMKKQPPPDLPAWPETAW